MSVMLQLEKLVDVAIETLVEVRTYYSRLNGVQELPFGGKAEEPKFHPVAPLPSEPVEPVDAPKPRRPRAKKEATATPLEPVAPSSFGLGAGGAGEGGRKPEPPDAIEDAGPRCRELMGLFVRKNLNANPPGYQQLAAIIKATCGREIGSIDQITPEEFEKLLPEFEKRVPKIAAAVPA